MRIIRLTRSGSDASCRFTGNQTRARRQRAIRFTLSAARSARGPTRSGPVRRYQLPAYAAWVLISRSYHGPVHPKGCGVADIEHAGSGLPRRGIERGGPQVWLAADHEHGSGQSVHIFCPDRLRRSGIRISMDGKGRFPDNIFVERLWRSPKYECVYPHAFKTGSGRALMPRWTSTTITSARIPPLAPDRQPCPIGSAMKPTTPIGRCKE